jgi:hypothetical protein
LTIRLDDIRPSPENDRLYRPVDPEDPQIIRLAESIRDCGMQEPLLITRDGWIISGHRRYAAARLAGLNAAPCRVEPIYKDADHNTFMMLLRECNRQRVKSFDEKLREEVLSDSAEDAYQALLAHRSAQARRATGQVRSFEIVGTTSRARITRAKTPMLKAVRRVLADLRDFHPLSARQVHYALLNDPPLRHASKPDSVYRNDSASYKSLLDLLTRARLAGLVPMGQVADETRPVETWNVHGDVQDYIGDELEIVLSVAKMPQGGLAAIHVHPGGLFYSPGGLSRLDVQGLNGFIAVASHVDEDGKASFILLNVAAGVETGDIARLTFVPSREAQGGDFILVNSLIELVGDQLSPIGQWIVGSPS